MDTTTAASRAPHQPRLEDDALLRGLGRFIADAPLPDEAQACFVRSPHAFADIGGIDIEAAGSVPGVLAVLTGADMDAAKIGNVSQHPPLNGRGGSNLVVPHRPALAGTTVRHVGEPVVLVVAETLAAAQDAAELVRIDYAERP
ncbi:MAG TPA: xanthine dehydrogenase family protein molybdopterin-binding subunit, partial [Xanthobacteraceae bacterium]